MTISGLLKNYLRSCYRILESKRIILKKRSRLLIRHNLKNLELSCKEIMIDRNPLQIFDSPEIIKVFNIETPIETRPAFTITAELCSDLAIENLIY